MSRTPLQQWLPASSDNRYPGLKPHVPDEESQALAAAAAAAAANNPYSTQEPPPFLLPGSQGFEPTMAPNGFHPRLSLQSRPWESGNDSKYNFPSGSGSSLAQYSLQRSSIPKNTEYAGPSGSYYDTSSRSRGSIGSVGRTNDMDSQYSSSSATFPSPVHSDKCPAIFPNGPPPTYPLQQRLAMPSGFENILHHEPIHPPSSRRASSTSRYHIHIRQQPIAARACGAGDRDRRPVDPPPILQMLLTDFDATSEDDREILQDNRFTVGCVLVPVSGPSSLPTSTEVEGEGLTSGQATPLLSGKTFVTPFSADEEPDPDTAPRHPSSNDHLIDSRRLIPNQSLNMRAPASFFIFSDLSVRAAGLYRLQFSLMNWGMVEDTGQNMPVLAEVLSDPFRVYPAKDFPGMRDSSPLTEKLKELGVTELKTRGKGRGKGRRVKGDPKGQDD